MSRPIRRLLITGAAGRLGGDLRRRLRGDFDLVRLTDQLPLTPETGNEECIACDLADAAGVAALCAGVDAIIHMGGKPNEGTWAEIMAPNIVGSINIWEGARKAGVDRVIYASSNHVTGFWRRDDRVNHDTAPRPDGRYGLSKAFAEDMAQMYAYKYGVRGFMMRIGSFLPEPHDERGLATWLSFGDCERLTRTGLTADYLYEVVFGISRNTRAWYDNSNAFRLGYDPQDDSERYAAAVVGKVTGDPINEEFQGAMFASLEFIGDTKRVP